MVVANSADCLEIMQAAAASAVRESVHVLTCCPRAKRVGGTGSGGSDDQEDGTRKRERTVERRRIGERDTAREMVVEKERREVVRERENERGRTSEERTTAAATNVKEPVPRARASEKERDPCTYT